MGKAESSEAVAMSGDGELRHSEHIRSVLNALLRTSLADIPLDEQLHRILDHIMSIPSLSLESKGCIFLVEGDPPTLAMKAQRNLAPPLLSLCARVPFGRCLCGRAAASGQVVFACCTDERHDNTYEGMVPHGHYCVPISTGSRVLGVLNLYVAEGHCRDPKDEEFLLAVADLLAGIIEHRWAEERLKDTLARLRAAMGAIIDAMALTVETRDPYTAGHQRRVADLARAIATEMNLAPDRIDGLRMAGVIHDLGKISVPAELLSKPTRLTPAEFELIKIHPQVGYDILKPIDFPWPVAQIVLQHHERLDGSGYPNGLTGDNILLEARILGVADVVEAMASHRPYRPALGLPKALEEVRKNMGLLYDPEVAAACLRLFGDKGYAFR